MRLAIVATHPVQYQSPWFRALAIEPNLDLQVFYCRVATPQDQAQAGFGVAFDWDVPLLEGYSYSILPASGSNGNGRSAIREILTRNRYDAAVVLGWHEPGLREAIWACWRTGTPILVRGDSTLYSQQSSWRRAVKRVPYRLLVPRFDACLAVGTRSKEYFLRYGARSNRVFCVPHVIGDYVWCEANRLGPERAQIRRDLGFGEGDTVFVFAGKFLPKKRPMDIIRAVEAASRRGAGTAGLLVGDGPLRHVCEAYAQARKLPIVFTGFQNQSEIVRSYIAADCLVLPSDGRETWGLVVNEAMACGLPAVVSDEVGCGPDLVARRGTGSIFPCGHVDRLAALLTYYTDNRSVLSGMGDRARQLSAEFQPAAAVQSVVEAVTSVVRTGRNGDGRT